jgi:predicted kinase
VEGNARAFTAEASGLDPAACADVTAAGLAEVERHAARLDRRKDEGRVRECHGDLHLRNAVLLDGSPTLFDGIEFNDELSCIDVAYDVAFLVMDLMHRRLPVHANVVFSHYLSLTGDLDALPLMPLFLSCRAAIRAKTSATAAGMEQDAEARAGLYRLAHAYLRMALDLLRPAPAVLVAVGGWSGSGKSTLVAHLAPEIGGAPGALVLRSDVLRKHLLGVPTEAHLGEEGYTPEVSRRVYERLVELAAEALGHGRAVIADAVWGRAEDRRRIAGAARAAGLRFVGLWLDAPRDTLASRLRARATDASDATVEVLDRQRQDTAPPDDWIRIDASGGADDTRRRAVQVLAQDD